MALLYNHNKLIIWLLSSQIFCLISTKDIDWCDTNLRCRSGKGFYQDNTMCVHKIKTNAGACVNIKNIQNDDKRQALVNAHNDLRARFALGEVEGWPPAAMMKKVAYSKLLEDMALRWAVQCENGHDECRKTPDWDQIGQNIVDYVYPLGSVDMDVVEHWSRNTSAINPSQTTAQLIFDKMDRIGCAHVSYEIVNGEALEYRQRVVCNYAPGVLTQLQDLYNTGPTCSQCPPTIKCLCEKRQKRQDFKKEEVTEELPRNLEGMSEEIQRKTEEKEEIQDDENDEEDNADDASTEPPAGDKAATTPDESSAAGTPAGDDGKVTGAAEVTGPKKDNVSGKGTASGTGSGKIADKVVTSTTEAQDKKDGKTIDKKKSSSDHYGSDDDEEESKADDEESSDLTTAKGADEDNGDQSSYEAEDEDEDGKSNEIGNARDNNSTLGDNQAISTIPQLVPLLYAMILLIASHQLIYPDEM